jgi:hypothetical protein
LCVERVEGRHQNIARTCGGDISDAQPILDARLEDGSRVAAMFPPCSVNGPTLTIRNPQLPGPRLVHYGDGWRIGGVAIIERSARDEALLPRFSRCLGVIVPKLFPRLKTRKGHGPPQVVVALTTFLSIAGPHPALPTRRAAASIASSGR